MMVGGAHFDLLITLELATFGRLKGGQWYVHLLHFSELFLHIHLGLKLV